MDEKPSSRFLGIHIIHQSPRWIETYQPNRRLPQQTQRLQDREAAASEEIHHLDGGEGMQPIPSKRRISHKRRR